MQATTYHAIMCECQTCVADHLDSTSQSDERCYCQAHQELWEEAEEAAFNQ